MDHVVTWFTMDQPSSVSRTGSALTLTRASAAKYGLGYLCVALTALGRFQHHGTVRCRYWGVRQQPEDQPWQKSE